MTCASGCCPALADGSLDRRGRAGRRGAYAGGAATGKAGVVISGHLADVLLVACG